jgi:hypothetical protein
VDELWQIMHFSHCIPYLLFLGPEGQSFTENREVCFLCEKKTFRKDRKLHKIESSDRLNNLRESAVGQNDQRMIQIMDENAFTENAVYHSPCITKYLLKYTPLNYLFVFIRICNCRNFLLYFRYL